MSGPPPDPLPEYDPEAVVYCRGKVRHPSRREALRNLNRVRRAHDAGGRDRRACGKLMVYRCGLCGNGWHLGNQEPRRLRAERARRKRPEDFDHEEAA